MAGIYETWVSPEGESITTCSIVTTEANDFMESIHHRMPVILRTEDQDAWLDPANEDVTTLKRLLRSRAPALSCHPVSPEVNSVRNNGPHCISPVNVAQPGK
jgi:putative SOS response-associated peptidase YedK